MTNEITLKVNDVDVKEIRGILTRENNALLTDENYLQTKRAEIHELMDHISAESGVSLVKRLKYVGSRGITLLKDIVTYQRLYDEDEALEYGDNYYDLLDRTFSLMNHRNTELSIQLYKPDVLAKMPFDAYGEIADYAKAQEIAENGRILMREALDQYEQSQAH